MAGQIGSLGFEELEAVEEAVMQPDDLAPAEEFRDETGQSELSESDEGEFEDFAQRETPIEDQPPGNGYHPPSGRTLAGLAARAAWRWGSQATVPGLKGYDAHNGHSPVSRLLEETPVKLSGIGYFNGRNIPSNSKTCSAALLEEYELMAALATAAARAESQAEAEGLIAALVPVSLRLYPQAYRALWPALPVLIQGSVGVTRLLWSRPATRLLIGVLPAILQRTTTQLARYVEQGQPITRSLTARVLAKQTGATLHRWRQTQVEVRHPYQAKW